MKKMRKKVLYNAGKIKYIIVDWKLIRQIE